MKTPPTPAQRARRRRLLAFACALGVHAGAYFVVTWVAPPALDLELELVDDLGFGLDQAMMTTLVSAPTPESAAPEATASEAPSVAPDEEPLPALDAAPPASQPPQDAAVPDAAPPPSKPPRDAAPPDAAPPDAALASQPPADTSAVAQTTTDAGPSAPQSAPAAVGLAASAPPGAVALPAGAQIALRLDLAAVRASPLSTDTAALLAAIPDWQRLLDGAGVDPVTALDRVVIATPSLSQTHMVMAGLLAKPGSGLVRAAVASLAQARGVPAPWTRVDGRPVAPWANADSVPRHVALLDDRHFAIAQLTDLPKVLALAQARAQQAPPSPPAPSELSDAGLPAPPPLSGTEALLWMPPDTVVSIDIDGARNLLRGQPALAPTALRVALVNLPEARVRLEAEARYPDETQAQAALKEIVRRQNAALQNPLTMMALGAMGLHTLVRDLTPDVSPDGLLRSRVELSYPQVKGMLAYIRTSLEARAQRAAQARAAAAEAASAPPSAVGSTPPSTPASRPERQAPP